MNEYRSARKDSYIDGKEYPDTGCAYGGPSCLSCALPECVDDMPPLIAKAFVAEVKLQVASGVHAVAAAHGVSARTVYRWQKAAQS